MGINHIDNADLLRAADSVLDELRNMSDDELICALESCDDHSLSYAIWPDQNEFDITNHDTNNV